MIGKLRRSTWVVIGLCAIAVLGIAVPASMYLFKFGGVGSSLAEKPDEWAFLGEYIGGLTGPALSLAALAALVANFILQTQQLEQARDVAETERVEAEMQRAVVSRQSFEGTFFQFLKQFVEVARGMAGLHIQGMRFFGGAVYKLRNEYELRMVRGPCSYEDDVRLTPDLYGVLYKEFQASLGPYFRNLYFIMKFIDLSDRSPEEKIRYANFVRAQMSTEEVLLLFYNGTWKEGLRFRDLIQRYGLLKHLPDEFLLNPKHLYERRWYAVSAFQNAEDRKNKSPKPSEANARVHREDFSPDLDIEQS
jgi:hypothetical protein